MLNWFQVLGWFPWNTSHEAARCSHTYRTESPRKWCQNLHQHHTESRGNVSLEFCHLWDRQYYRLRRPQSQVLVKEPVRIIYKTFCSCLYPFVCNGSRVGLERGHSLLFREQQTLSFQWSNEALFTSCYEHTSFRWTHVKQLQWNLSVKTTEGTGIWSSW